MTLKDDMKTDMDTFFDPDEFAVLAIWKRDGQEDKEVYGHFDSELNTKSDSYSGMSKPDSSGFSFSCKYSDIEGMGKDAKLTIGGDKYVVASKPKNVYGFSKIILNEDYK